MALANLEGIASYLNEAKRVREQQEVVSNLSAAVTRLPFRLSDSKRRWLHRQDVVTRLVRPHPLGHSQLAKSHPIGTKLGGLSLVYYYAGMLLF